MSRNPQPFPTQIFALVAILGLSVCATAAAVAQDTVTPVFQARISCISATHLEPQFASITKHFPMWVNQMTIAQLADRSSPTKHDSALISTYDEKMKACDAPYFSLVQQAFPTLASVYVSERLQEDDAWVNLVQGKINWGEFNKRLKDIYADGDAKESIEFQKMNAAVAQQQQEAQQEVQQAAQFQEQQDAQRRAAAAQMIFNAFQNYGRNATPPQTNCTTTYALGTAYTHCQ